MKLFFFLIILLFLNSCSFDDKTGIWKNENIKNEKDDTFKDFKKLSLETKLFSQSLPVDKSFKFSISNSINNSTWNDIFYKENNNFENFQIKGLNQIFYKSKKLSKHDLNEYILYANKNVISSDLKGNLIINSLTEKKEIKKFNFYKKKYKKIEKKTKHSPRKWNNICF